LYLDFLWNTQGEDVVAGRHIVLDDGALHARLPAIDRQLRGVCSQLERLFCDTQDFEFTIQEGRLYLLQSRSAKRTPWAALRVACDLVKEGLIDERTALERLADMDVRSLQMTRLANKDERPPLSVGIAASPGVAIGQIAFDPHTAVGMAHEGCRPILVRQDISTDDVAGLAVSEGILTMLGGRTSHAAVVARQMNKVCIVGCRDLVIEGNRKCHIGAHSLAERDFISLDGHSGAVYAGEVQCVTETPQDLLSLVSRWQRDEGEKAFQVRGSA
jgi:pyruvate,orthophosphate dikinase